MDLLLMLPPELKERILMNLKKIDLLNIACCSKTWCETIEPFLYWKIAIPLNNIGMLSSSRNMKYTRALNICGASYFDRPPWHELRVNYWKTIKNCDPYNIAELEHSNCDISNEELEVVFEQFPHLEKVSIISCYKIKGSCLEKICKLYGSILKELRLTRMISIISIHGFQCLDLLVNLEVLDIQKYRIPDDTYIHICNTLCKLKILRTRSCNLSDESLDCIGKLKSLHELDLSNSEFEFDLVTNQFNKISDIGILCLVGNNFIRTLKLGSNYLLTDEGVRLMTSIENLTCLDLSRTDISDLGLLYLSKLNSLQTLCLKECSLLTDSGVGHLELLPVLVDLDIRHCEMLTGKCYKKFPSVTFVMEEEEVVEEDEMQDSEDCVL